MSLVMMAGVGVGFYGLAVFLKPLQDAHGWSNTAVSGATGAYFVISGVATALVGPHVDRRGPDPFPGSGIDSHGAGDGVGGARGHAVAALPRVRVAGTGIRACGWRVDERDHDALVRATAGASDEHLRDGDLGGGGGAASVGRGPDRGGRLGAHRADLRTRDRAVRPDRGAGDGLGSVADGAKAGWPRASARGHDRGRGAERSGAAAALVDPRGDPHGAILGGRDRLHAGLDVADGVSDPSDRVLGGADGFADRPRRWR